MYDVLIVGGGVIGLSLAWDLARHGQSVGVIDRGQPGREASWAGAGILPAVNRATAIHPYDQLGGLSSELHPEWAGELKSITGIDTGYRCCGGLYLARTPGEAAALAAWADDQAGQGVNVQKVVREELADIEPGLRGSSDSVSGTQYSVLSTKYSALPKKGTGVFSLGPHVAVYLPDEAQLRNPRHLQALIAACSLTGVQISANVAAADIAIAGNEIREIATATGPLRARRYCFTAGAWTGQLLARLGVPVAILPLRGQMVMFCCPEGAAPIRHIINEGSRYIVPRDDGRVLGGSTEEEVGFDKRTTEDAIADLAAFARTLVPALADAPIERSWAGLRPASFDGLPYLGPLPGLSNAYIAAGHFRSGLFLSPATAVVMSQLLRGEPGQIDFAPFRVGR
ncbi:MAG: FAD-dependent oxidoreductase [Planctomycetaceae bacterium]|nr:FAD-dependent oxidoreductase [Planctomycetaceae bacterium]